jgi:hypothetical protein
MQVYEEDALLLVKFYQFIIYKRKMKTCQSSIKQSIQQRGRKRYKIAGPKSWQMKNLPNRVDCYRNRNKSSTQREREREKGESVNPISL